MVFVKADFLLLGERDQYAMWFLPRYIVKIRENTHKFLVW